MRSVQVESNQSINRTVVESSREQLAADAFGKPPLSGRTIAVILLLLDVLGFFLPAALFCFLYPTTINALAQEWHQVLVASLWIFTGLIITIYIFDLYKPDSQVAGLRSPGRVLFAVAIAGALITLCTVFIRQQFPAHVMGAKPLTLTLGTYAIWASVIRYNVAMWLRKRDRKIKWIVMGEFDRVGEFWKDFRKAFPDGEFIYLSDRRDSITSGGNDGLMVSGSPSDLDQWLETKPSGVVIANGTMLEQNIIEKLMIVRLRGLQVLDLTDFYEKFWFKVPVFHLQNGWFAMSHGFALQHNTVGLRLKHLLDKFFAVILLVLSLPFLLLLGLAIKIDSRGPMIYSQKRTGQGGREFMVYKFRSMVKDAEAAGAQWAVHGDARVTRVGRVIRKLRLDELPQLVNVIKGDMSFIGPRPERPVFNEKLEKLIPYYDLRHIVKPGVTGWAQVLYPYAASVDDSRQKLQYDIYYIKNYSFMLDVSIILKTVRVVLFGKGR